MGRKNFKSRNPELEPYVDADICLKRGVDIDSYCVFKSTYGADVSQVDENYTTYSPCITSAQCNQDVARNQFNSWISQFFP